MTYRAEFKEDWGSVYLVLAGNVDIHDCYAFCYSVRDLLVAHNCRKLLVDAAQADVVLSDKEQTLFSKSHSDLLPLGLRIAVVVDDNRMKKKDAFGAPLAAAGVTHRPFRSKLEALDWLL
jgi:hypothetical protein